jgi:hypothetical protein
MKFAAKYEILEPITRGSVETFVARSLGTDERVLVHIFECPEQRSDQPTVQWVLESFQAVAPAPAELVLATGSYSGTSYAYLATKLPDNAKLQEWVRSYEEQQQAQERGTPVECASVPEFSHQREENLLPPAPEIDQSTVIRGIDQPKVMTIVEELRLNSSALSQTNAPITGQRIPSGLSDTIIDFSGTDFRLVGKVQQREPGESIEQVSGAENTLQEEQPRSVTPSDKALNLVGAASTPPGVGLPNEAPSDVARESTPDFANPAGSAGITDLFGFSDASQPRTSLETAAKSGEFTRFFQGPFHGERPSETPNLSPSLPRPDKQSGEFTEIFGKSENSPSRGTFASESPVRDVPVTDDPGGLTHFFKSADTGPKIMETYEPGPQHTEILENGRKFPAFVEPASPSAPVLPKTALNSPADPAVPKFGSGKSRRDTEEAFALRSEADATRVFSAPGRELADVSSPPQAGPSDFTRIISGGLMEPTPVEEPTTGSRDDFVERLAAAPAISVRSPLPTAPSTPQLQPPGHFPQMPSPKGVATSHAPTASRLGTASPKPAGVPWTLIIIINGLVIIAVMLVLYFALKH